MLWGVGKVKKKGLYTLSVQKQGQQHVKGGGTKQNTNAQNNENKWRNCMYR